MQKEWLVKIVTVEEVEIKHAGLTEPEAHVADEKLRARRFEEMKRVFGFMHDRWVEFKGMIQPGDELWEFCSDKRSWQQMAGRAGYCIVRNGEIVSALCSKMN